MNNDVITHLRANLFPASHAAIKDWDHFPWHKDHSGKQDTHKSHSSQALAIDVFGTLKNHPARNKLLNSLAEDLSIPVSDQWSIHLEWISPTNPLHEIHQHTQVDAIAENDQSIIFFECKFTEQDGGICSQTQALKKGAFKGTVQCAGNYGLQTNPANGKTSCCALTAKGIRYWEVIPEVFEYDSNSGYSPCPFAGSWYQWMRNITNAYAIAHETGRQAAFCLIYANGSHLPVMAMVNSGRWNEFLAHLKSGRIPVRAISYQELISIVKTTDHDEIWGELSKWVENKIDLATHLTHPG